MEPCPTNPHEQPERIAFAGQSMNRIRWRNVLVWGGLLIFSVLFWAGAIWLLARGPQGDAP